MLAEQERFDALVLDVMLPGKDGFAVATELRAAGKYMPILMLTARGRAEDVLQGFEAGADDYLAKPFELTILLARLSGLLRRSRWNEQDAPAAPEPVPTSTPFAGRTIDFIGDAGPRAWRVASAHADGMRAVALPRQERRSASVSRRRSSRTSGTCTREPTPAPSTTSSSGCAATSRIDRRRRGSC